MSVTSVRSYFRARGESVGLKEWKDGFNFQNNGYFKIVNVSKDSMTLTGKPIETTYKLLLSKPITANAGDIITQDSTVASAYALESVVYSQELSVL